MTDDELAEKIKAECMHGDAEIAHGHADNLIVEHLRDIGFPKAAAAWDAVDKWYA